ncbi:fibrillin-1 isoform X4 [Aedes aegypti]|uniref:EGF-like domain-containing protein n=1 Tax=Aedes aegypti TaxID=7159 RepID=A0A6I8T3M7_AEDAE|nr:fibrillin-1 isoform X4 [Aedes aegypti]
MTAIMDTKIRGFLLLVCFVGCAKSEAIAIEQILSLCCQEGEEWGTQHKLCSSFNNTLEIVPGELRGLCLSTVEICCSKQHKIYKCTEGQIAARQGLSCSLKGHHSGSEFYTDCCEACKIGLVVGSSSSKCSVEPFAFGSPWDEVYEGCCKDIKQGDDTFILNEEDENIDECEDQAACDEGFVCVNIKGSYDCIPFAKNYPVTKKKMVESCSPGFRRHNEQCIDIDECAVDKYACDSNQVCTNEIGGFRCDCKIGFTLDQVTNACVDINECQINAHECLESQRCDNTIGSYTCIRLQSCGTGYTLNAETGNCDDDDECALGRHNCVPPYECFNTKGSFRCRQRSRYAPQAVSRVTGTSTSTSTSTSTTTTTTTARPVYYTHTTRNDPQYRPVYQPNNQQVEYNRYQGSCGIGFERNALGACVDVDECLNGNTCRSNQRCVNSNGSYRCYDLLVCPSGFVANSDATECLDVDECSTGKAKCGPDQICKNKRGSYVCHCPAGFIIGKHQRCEDINECEMHKGMVCPHNSECINTLGSYRCDCKAGFKKNHPEDMVCTDQDECSEIPGLCHQRCINYYGSYRCGCEPGYKLMANNRTCEDVDECVEYKSNNLCVGICENSPGSYGCSCPQGYRLGHDGRSCIDIDECETRDVCNARNEICTNIRGSFRCTRIDCPYEYEIDPDRTNRCRRTTRFCQPDDIECLRKPSSYSYNFITLTSNMPVPPSGRALFNLRGPTWYESIDFDMKLIHVDAPGNVQPADERFFSLNKLSNEVLLNLVKSIEGPQDIELELSMTVFNNGQPFGSNIAKLFLLISAHEF